MHDLHTNRRRSTPSTLLYSEMSSYIYSFTTHDAVSKFGLRPSHYFRVFFFFFLVIIIHRVYSRDGLKIDNIVFRPLSKTAVERAIKFEIIFVNVHNEECNSKVQQSRSVNTAILDGLSTPSRENVIYEREKKCPEVTKVIAGVFRRV